MLTQRPVSSVDSASTKASIKTGKRNKLIFEKTMISGKKSDNADYLNIFANVTSIFRTFLCCLDTGQMHEARNVFRKVAINAQQHSSAIQEEMETCTAEPFFFNFTNPSECGER